MVDIQDLFEVGYGTKLDLNKLSIDDDGVLFVSRTSKNNGVSARVAEVEGIVKQPEGSITVSLGGTKLLSSFVQNEPYYTAQNVAVLVPKHEMTLQEKLYYCLCIEKNRFRYSAFGREANRTIKTIKIPSLDKVPAWVNSVNVNMYSDAGKALDYKGAVDLNTLKWSNFRFDDLFEIKKGKRLTKAKMHQGTTPFIGSTNSNNGVTNWVGQIPLHDGNVITVNYNGSVGEAFYQPIPFWASDDVNVLYPKSGVFKTFNQYIAMFIISLIKMNKFRFNYGRKWHKERMSETLLLLPVTDSGDVDVEVMERYIKTLPYTKKI